MQNYAEYDPLLSKYLDGSISADELGRLESKLLSHEAFAQHFSQWCLLHRQVTELLTESTLHQIMDQFAQGSPSLPISALSQLASGNQTPPSAPLSSFSIRQRSGRSKLLSGRALSSRPSIFGRFWLRTTAAAALILITVGLIHHFSNRTPPELAAGDVNAPRRESSENLDVAATLTQLVDGVWAPKATVLQAGQLLGKGNRIALKSGMAKVTFECGAEVVLQGPCDFEVQNQMAGFLKSGRITANVPHRAFSFSIQSPQVDFVDLGTAFGISVGSTGKTELHVFEGEVLCSPSKAENADHKEPIHVTAANALAFDSKGGDPSNIAMNKDQFSSLIDLRRTAGHQPQGLSGDHLALWLTADMGVTTDALQRVISWQDILYGDNHSAEDATQNDEKARPTLVPNALNGRPAIRFNGQSDYMVTTPLETVDNQTVIFVCQFSPNAYDKRRIWGGQIINYDGPPSRFLSNTLEPGVLQIGEPLLAEEFKPTLMTGQVFAGFVGSATVESGRVDAEQVGVDMPFIGAYVYDYTHGRATLSINGRSYGEARAFAPQSITSRKIIGRHAWKQLFFSGDLAEMLIYNRAMSPSELAESTAYLGEKYAIKLSPQPHAEHEVNP